MIGDEFTLNLAEINRGDIQIVANDNISQRYYEASAQGNILFSQGGVERLRQWAEDEGLEIQFGSNQSVIQALPLRGEGQATAPVTLIPILIEPERWPFYGVVTTTNPPNLSLSEALSSQPRAVVMSQRVAQENDLTVGSQFTVGANGDPFTIVALVDDEAEGRLVLGNGPAGLIGYIYYPLPNAEDMGLESQPERAFVQVPLGRNVEDVEDSLVETMGRRIARNTTAELAEENQETADLISDLILVMGLSSILIGGMGIINTMNVIVSRRMLEIAVLKTLGLKAWRVTALFLVEAALMGILGSLIGVGAGIILSYFVRGIGEEVLNTSLTWRAYPEAWYSGLTLGIVITITFGFLPTLNAGQIRPIGVLRPNDIQLPTAGLTRTLLALITTIVLFGLTLNSIVAGRLELPISLMLGLFGFIIGLFGGAMLANERANEDPTTLSPAILARRGVTLFAGALAAFVLIGLGAIHLFLQPIPAWVLYPLPLALGAGLYAILLRLEQVGLWINRLTRQVLLWGGALLLGGLIGGGIYALARAVLVILYPSESPTPYLTPALIISLGLGFLSFMGFRLRVQRAAELVGLALMGAAVLSILGFGLGDLLKAIFGGLPFWDGVETWATGIIVVEIITLALGGAFLVMQGMVWLMARLPSFGNVDLKLAMRNINARKTRTSATMIGLIVGVGALSLITLTTSGVTSLLESQLETNVGGNVIIISRDPDTGEAVKKRLDNTLEGVNSYTQYTIYRGRILLVDGQDPDFEGLDDRDAADGNTREFGRSRDEPGIGFAFVTTDPLAYQPDFRMKAGRYFTPADVGQPVMVMRDPLPGSFLDQIDLELGSEITWRMQPPPGEGPPLEITYTIIGIIDRNSEETGAGDALQAPNGSIPAIISPDSVLTVADIQEPYVDAALIEFAQITNAFALEVSFLVDLIRELLNQLTAIPALVAALALVAGVAIIANTVALDTQERRTQIGVMKAVGLKGWRVLAQLMFENAYIGLVAGLIGVGIGLVATLLVGVLGQADQVEQTLDLAPALRLLGLSVLISLASTLLSAWSAAKESPMNVLRYE
jgi:ABC-type antimicrobial peptide transport system permease subunit